MKKSFLRISLLSVFLVILVIIAGSVVRMSGSGMGCPDWPKCFGKLIPPFSESELPSNYQEIYAHRGYAVARFNVFHTWTEYINRLLGALLGVVVIVQAIMSIKYYKISKKIVLLSVFQVFLVGFQAWLGATVVYSILAPFKITIHMVAAMVIVCLGIAVYALAEQSYHQKIQILSRKYYYIISGFLAIIFVQLILGTQVREQIDHISKELSGSQRELWIEKLNYIFIIHRSLSPIIMAFCFWILYKVRNNQVFSLVFFVTILVVVESLVGAVLSHFYVPKILQPVHLLLVSLIVVMTFYILVRYRKS